MTQLSFRRINVSRPRRSSKGHPRSHLCEAGSRVRLRGGEALTQKSRGGQSPRSHYPGSSDACVVRLDLHIFPTLIKFSQKAGEVG